MFRERCGVAVIGGGPAGAWCATLLARAGVDVIIVHDEQRGPTSVELLSGRARWLVRGIELRGIDVGETHSWWGDAEPLVRNAFWDPYGPALAIDRREFDETLRRCAQRAGARIVEMRARRVAPTRGGWNVDDRVGAAQLVLATGCGAPRLPRRARTLVRQRAVLALYAAESPPHLCIERHGQGWLYSLPDPRGGTFVGLCTSGAEDLDGAIASSRLLALGATTSHTRWACAASVRRYDRVADARWIAVGNAAFGPDPLSGGGLWFALHTAARAAAVVLGPSTPAAYQHEVDLLVEEHLRSRHEVLLPDHLATGIEL